MTVPPILQVTVATWAAGAGMAASPVPATLRVTMSAGSARAGKPSSPVAALLRVTMTAGAAGTGTTLMSGFLLGSLSRRCGRGLGT